MLLYAKGAMSAFFKVSGVSPGSRLFLLRLLRAYASGTLPFFINRASHKSSPSAE